MPSHWGEVNRNKEKNRHSLAADNKTLCWTYIEWNGQESCVRTHSRIHIHTSLLEKAMATTSTVTRARLLFQHGYYITKNTGLRTSSPRIIILLLFFRVGGREKESERERRSPIHFTIFNSHRYLFVSSEEWNGVVGDSTHCCFGGLYAFSLLVLHSYCRFRYCTIATIATKSFVYN